MMKHYFKFLTWLGLLFMLGIYYPVDLAAQTGKTVQGVVRDSNTAEGIPGVNVIEKGTTNGTVTDLDGSFRLTVNSDNSTLEFSFIGYTKKELLVGNQTQLNVNLEENMSELGEVVVVGFGSKGREDITGSVSSVKMDKILGDRPVTDAARALQGTVPGLQVTFGTGQPGQSTRLNIRGFESINGGRPLVLVDNIPMNIDDINPRDIEEVTVLKDASA
ncbi:carboxypeptidase-like regulatory domain-containing protein, partial [Belliella pelovolcani]|uniref:carboxypeptidase-like regulatory domain-containing protein n=1 Tax=Belliella pelovolcani TaxID=529505 RepID=UPI00391A5808